MNDINQFNRVAGSYDLLGRLVFGNTLQKAQLVYLSLVPAEANVLILGGGTGQVLKYLLSVNSSCRVWYIEASSSMIKSATKNIREMNNTMRVNFIHGTHDSIPGDIRFDVVIANFFLDLFSHRLNTVIRKIKDALQPNGDLLITDFVDGGKVWQKVMLSSMYLFFNTTCKIEAKALPAWQRALRDSGFAEAESIVFYKGFIKTVRLRRVNG